MGVILDSSVLIDAERGRLDIGTWLDGLGDEPIAISSISASELLHGVHLANSIARRRSRERFVEWILATIPIVEFGLEEARTHALLWAELRSAGTTVGAHDLLIAATAVTLGFRVATADVRSFGRIPSLQLADSPPPRDR